LVTGLSQTGTFLWKRRNNLKIFVVDDDEQLIDLLSIILENEGFKDVQCFSSSLDGLAALKRAQPTFDCLILDVEMPKMNGIDLCREIRALQSYKNVPIIMLTALRDDLTFRAALEAGATDYITKPFDVLQIGVRLRLSAKLVRAHRALNYLRTTSDQKGLGSYTFTQANGLREIENIFVDVFDWVEATDNQSK
jgi:DNA-binding response OmpR family regulator